MGDAFLYAWREIRRRKRRSIGNILGYVLAVAVMVVVASAIGSHKDATVKVLWDIGAHSMAYVSAQCTPEEECPVYALDSEREGFVANNAPAELIPSDKVEAIRKSPNVADACPYLVYRIKASEGPGEWVLGGFDPSRPLAFSATMVAKKQVADGKFLEPGDKGVVMVEKEFATAYGLKVDSDLKLGDLTYKVAAIVTPPLRPGKANVYMTLADLRALVNTRVREPLDEAVSAVLVESKGAKFHDKAKADMQRILGNGSHVTSYGCYRPGTLAMGIHEDTAWFMTLLVVACMVALALKTQYSTVIERRFDIGVLKAIGWTDGHVVSQIVTESLFHAVVGGLLGCAAAVVALQLLPAELLVGADAKAPLAVQPIVLLTGFLIALAGGLIAGIVPAMAAARMRPADILRRL